MDVDFRPANRSDVRFDGLIDITDSEFDRIRDGLLADLEQVFGAILAGRSEEDVYALWRELTAEQVAAAERRHRLEARFAPAAVEDRVATSVARSVAHGPEPADDAVHCVLVLGKGAFLNASVLIASLREHASRPLHLWALPRPGAERMEARLAERFPDLGFTWVPARGPRRRLRLLLPDLLPQAERVIVLPLPSVATGDIAELADLDLGGHGVAAPRRPGVSDISGFGVIHDAALRLGDRTRAASALRRTAHARHAFDFDAFTGDVLVLDLDRLRRDGFSAQAIPLAQEFGLDDVEALHYLCGPDRATVPERWAVVPTRTPERGPGLLYWADGVRPWQQVLTPERDEWRRHAAAFRGAGVPARA
jgi:hypothetical protein